jgi:hypothetical protein
VGCHWISDKHDLMKKSHIAGSQRVHENPQIVALSDLPTVSRCQVQNFTRRGKWRREWDDIVCVAGKGLVRNPLIALRRLIGFHPISSQVSQQSWRECTHSARRTLDWRRFQRSGVPQFAEIAAKTVSYGIAVWLWRGERAFPRIMPMQKHAHSTGKRGSL